MFKCVLAPKLQLRLETLHQQEKFRKFLDVIKYEKGS